MFHLWTIFFISNIHPSPSHNLAFLWGIICSCLSIGNQLLINLRASYLIGRLNHFPLEVDLYLFGLFLTISHFTTSPFSNIHSKSSNPLENIRITFVWGGNNRNSITSWITWSKIMGPKQRGGLWMASLRASNLALLLKWWLRYKNEPLDHWLKF